MIGITVVVKKDSGTDLKELIFVQSATYLGKDNDENEGYAVVVPDAAAINLLRFLPYVVSVEINGRI